MALLDEIRMKIATRLYELSKHAVDQTIIRDITVAELEEALLNRSEVIETEVTYTIEHDGKFYLIKNVPARVCRETGEQYFAPETVEHIQALIRGKKPPAKVIETPVYEYT
jgi:YgiT-type zinc finger domain-containing protein